MKFSKEELFDIFTVDFFGGHLINRYDRNYNSRAGMIVGCNVKKGRYRTVRIRSEQVFVHRIIYQMYHGDLTEEYIVDHIDNNTLNNSIKNLRKATVSQNNSNLSRGDMGNNNSGIRNVYTSTNRDGSIEYWRVIVNKDKKPVFDKKYRKDRYNWSQIRKIAKDAREEVFGDYC